MDKKRKVFLYHSIEQLEQRRDILLVRKEIDHLSEIDTNDFIYIKDTHTIEFSGIGSYSTEEYQKIYDFVKRLDDNGNKCRIHVYAEITDRNKFNSVFFDKKFNNIKLTICSNDCSYSFRSYKREENKLNGMVREILSKNFTPFERYLAVLNIAKNYKPYREEGKNADSRKSRCLKYILNNDYMVCKGYTTLLCTLGKRVGLNIEEISVRIGEFNKDEEYSWHSICMFSLDDDVYNIHGLYISDPTWDNDLSRNLFNHALMTFDQMDVSKAMFYHSDCMPILDIHNFEEYNEQINYYIKDYFADVDDTWNLGQVLDMYDIMIRDILHPISCDPKYNYFREILKNCKSEDDYFKLLDELGNYLVTRINKKIDDNLLIDTMLFVDEILDHDNDEKKVVDDYYKYDLLYFPYRIDKKNEHNLIKKRVNRCTRDGVTKRYIRYW